MRGFSRRITALAALLASTSTTALAQEESDGANNDDEIVVTAQRREQSLLDVPLAVSALAGDDLAQKGISNSAQLGAAFRSTARSVTPNPISRFAESALPMSIIQTRLRPSVFISMTSTSPRAPAMAWGCSILTGLKCCVDRKARSSGAIPLAVL